MINKSSFKIRKATIHDIKPASEIFLQAFNSFNATVGLPPEWPNLEFCEGIVGSLIQNPGFYAIVAEDHEGRIIGSNFLEKHDDITAPGPISVDNKTQNGGVGRALMQEVIDYSYSIEKKEIRLVQVSNNTKSYALYASMGFEPRETMTAIVGYVDPNGSYINNEWVVRDMEERDAKACDELFKSTNQFSRFNDIAGSMHLMTPHQPYVITNSTGKLLGYTTGLFLLGHTICESQDVFKALISSISNSMKKNAVPRMPPPIFHLTARLYPGILQWSLKEANLKILRQEVMLTMGRYCDPQKNVYCPGMAY